MITFNVRSCNSIHVVPCLQVTDLQRMVDMGFLCEDDEIRKDGHRTWYPASTVVGLNFKNPNRKEKITNKVDDWIFQLHRENGRVDGPFDFETIKNLLNSGNITLDCKLLPPACMNPIKIGKFRSITTKTPAQRLFIKWDDDKTDGPMLATLVQDLIREGVVPKTCLVRGEDESEWCDFSSYEFGKKKLEKANIQLRNPKQNEEEYSTKENEKLPAIQQQDEEVSEEVSEEENDKPITRNIAENSKYHSRVLTIENHRQRSPYRTIVVTFSVIALVFAVCFAIVFLLIGVDKSNPIDALVKNLPETANPLSDIDIPKGVHQNTAATGTANSILPPIMNAPKHGPIWIHEQLNIPIFGAHVDPHYFGLRGTKFYRYPKVWMPQVFFIDAKATMLSDINFVTKATMLSDINFVTAGSTVRNPIVDDYIEVKGEYNTIKDGKETWCWELDNRSPKRTWEDKELFFIGKWMGLTNWIGKKGKNLTTKNPEVPWLFSESKLFHGKISLIPNTDDTISKIVGSNRSIVFERDEQNRPTSAAWFDKRGEDREDVLLWKYDNQNNPISLKVFSDEDSKTNFIQFTPGYENNGLGTLHGTGASKVIVNGNDRSYLYNIHVAYSYDIRNRIDYALLKIEAILLDITLAETHKFLSEFTVTYNYDRNSDYWQTATLSGNRTDTNLSTSSDNNIIKKHSLGTVRFIRELIE